MSSNPVYVTHFNIGLGHTQNVKVEYFNVVPDYCIDHKNFESRSSIFQAYNLEEQAF